jgi:ribosomal protein L37AE/L43A
MVTTIASRPPTHSPAAPALELAGPATCPSCHAADLTMTDSAVATGANWRCRRCGQLWDVGRLAAVAAYAVWLSERAAPAANRAT